MSGEGDGGSVPPSQARPCPICGRPATAEAYPFCSKRCADVDLNRWLSGVYAIPGPNEGSEDEQAD